MALICPFRCVLCDAPARDMDLCAECRADLPWLGSACRRCAMPLTAVASGSDLCALCAVQPPPGSAWFAALVYEYPVNRMIAALKFAQRSYMARITGELLAQSLRTHGGITLPDRVVPVPLHAVRWRERGYNQAELIAATVASDLRLPCSPDVLSRSRPTATQMHLDREERLQNLRAAFSAQETLTGQRIALVDDVLTTGATAAACVHELQRSGAADVQVWAVARTI